jgi:multiple sugar transport system substrate-binding protein
MQQKRRFWYASLCLVLALLLTACVPPQAAVPAGDPAAPTTAGEAAASNEVIEIEYWQYNFEARITAMNQLIEQFQAENPNIRVLHNSDVPYDDFLDKIAASVPAGVGPDVVSLFYGWQLDWIDSEYIVPLPEDAFPPAMVAEEFSPMVQASFF